ncbi:MAG: hypothetical protein KatS3mg097_090 [Candidatus Parcubacteria bacterium]|nr:MAG: hypothetical protein KatS3mg097_090 [Candidatus Parcubacteria bacterium]
MEGLVVFNKPQNYTSRQIVDFLKNREHKKIGHGGSLDPFADGILILGIDKATKQLSIFLKNSIKIYIAGIILGCISDTYDRDGIIEFTHKEIPDFLYIEKILSSYQGEMIQVPPAFSAVKIKGVPAYKLARKGINFQLKPKKIIIYDLKILDFQKYDANSLLFKDFSFYKFLPSNNSSFNIAFLKLELKVSSGTYIRSLASDIGKDLKCGAYLESLTRTTIMANNYVFTLEEGLTFDDFKKDFFEVYIRIYGLVQGVGFRFFTLEKANLFNIKGYVRNLNDGSLEIIAQGSEQSLLKFLSLVKQGPLLSRVENLEIVFKKPRIIFKKFDILK